MSWWSRHPKLAVALLLLAALAARMVWVSSQRRTVPGSPPVAELEFHKHWITVRPVPGTPLADLVDLSLFGAFRPGMMFDDANASSGPPSNIRTEKHNTYYEYRIPSGRVEIGREEYSTGGGIGTEWALYAYPDDRTVDAVLIPQIAKYVDPNSSRTGIQIVFGSGRLSLFVDVRGRRVDHLIWFEE